VLTLAMRVSLKGVHLYDERPERNSTDSQINDRCVTGIV
jgi:hypothetical protein